MIFNAIQPNGRSSTIMVYALQESDARSVEDIAAPGFKVAALSFGANLTCDCEPCPIMQDHATCSQ